MRQLIWCAVICAATSISLTILAGIDLDLSGTVFEEGNTPTSVTYKTYYDSGQADFMLGNASTVDIERNHHAWLEIPTDASTTGVNFGSIEICYDVFAYKPSGTRLGPPFLVPTERSSGSKIAQPVDTWIAQLRIAKPKPRQPGSFEVIYDFALTAPRSEGYQCIKEAFPYPYPLPTGSQVSAWVVVGDEDVLRVDRVTLGR